MFGCSRPSWILAVITLCVVTGLVSISCSSGDGDADGGGLTIAVIPKGTTHEFWKSIHAGALKAKAELAKKGVDVEGLDADEL